MKKNKNTEAKHVDHDMFVNKDGYAKSVDISIPSQNIEVDPRGKSSIRGAGARIPTGDVADVRGTKAMLPEKKKTAKWY